VSSNNHKDCADLYISWLSGLKVITQVVKPPEHAFALPQTYYTYVDPWQVRVLLHFSLLDEKTKLGRNVYIGVSQAINSAPSHAHQEGNSSADVHVNGISKSIIDSSFAQSSDEKMRFFGSVIQSVLQMEAIQSVQSVKLSNNDFDSKRREVLILDAAKRSYDLLELWELSGSERFLTGYISQVHPQQHREDVLRAANNAYLTSLLKQMYRNALYCRLYMPYRFSVYLQVDLYYFKEITRICNVDVTQLQTANDAGTILSGDGVNYQVISTDAALNASQSPRASSVDVFATITIGRASGPQRQPKKAQGDDLNFSRHSSMGSFMAAASHQSSMNLSHVSSRINVDGTAVTPCHKAEVGQLPPSMRLPHSVLVGATNIASSNPTHLCSRLENSMSYVQMASDYAWREQALFRFALPEGIISLQSQCRDHPTNANSKELLTPITHGSFYSCPDTVMLSVYERTFFSDNKLGDLHLSLNELSERRVIKGWYPLVVDKSITWLVYLQVKLRFPLEVIDRPSSSQPGVTNIFKQYIDKASESRVPVEDVKRTPPRTAKSQPSGTSSPVRQKQPSYLRQLDDFF